MGEGMHGQRWWIRGLCVALLVLLVGPQGVSATGGGMGCNPHRTNDHRSYLDGSFDTSSRYPSASGGVYAAILDYSPWVDPSGQDVSAWDMLQVPGDPNRYTQTGWLEQAYGQRYTWTEINNGIGSFTHYNFPALPIGQYFYYTTTYNPRDPNNAYCHYANGQFLRCDLYEVAFLSQADVSGEIHTLASQMPGGYYNSEVFADIHNFYPAGTGYWHNFNETVVQYDPNYFNHGLVAQNRVAINDRACLN